VFWVGVTIKQFKNAHLQNSLAFVEFESYVCLQINIINIFWVQQNLGGHIKFGSYPRIPPVAAGLGAVYSVVLCRR